MKLLTIFYILIILPYNCFSLSISPSSVKENNPDYLPECSEVNYLEFQNQEIPKESQYNLEQAFQTNLKYFLDFGIHPETGLPYDSVTIDTQGNLIPAPYTSITNIGLELAVLTSAYKSNSLPEDEFINKVTKILNTIDKLEVYQGESKFEGKKYLYNWYDLNTLRPTQKWISSVDLAWFVTGLIVTEEAVKENHPQISQRLNNWINAIDFSLFYNKNSGLMRTGYKVRPFGLIPAGEYQNLNSESRMISYLAIGKQDISTEEAVKHWQALNRARADKNKCFGLNIVASWGGAAFEFGMPAIFVDELNLGEKSFGYNFKKAMLVQILQAIDKNYLIWGESPSTTPYYGYEVYGSPAGVHPFHSKGVITPHASFLALTALPEEVSNNIKVMRALFPGSFDVHSGTVDAIDTNTERPIFKYMALDQAMATLSLANALNDNIIVKLFHKSNIGKNIEPFIKNEQFFTDEEIKNELEQLFAFSKKELDEGNWFQGYAILKFLESVSSNFDYLSPDELETELEKAKTAGINEYQTLLSSVIPLLTSQNYNDLLQARDNLKKAITRGIWLGIDIDDSLGLLNQVKEKIETLSPLHPELSGLIISDFNDLARPTEHMPALFEWTTGSAFTNISFEETSESEHRVVMKLDYLVISKTATGVIIKLKDVDLRNYNYLVFDVKSAPAGFGEKFKIELKYQGGNWPYPSYEVSNITTEWKRVYIPLNELVPGIPKDKLDKITELATVFDINSGTIYIDNLHFE